MNGELNFTGKGVGVEGSQVCRLLRVAVGLAAKGFRVPSLRAHALKERDKQICSVFAPGNFKKDREQLLVTHGSDEQSDREGSRLSLPPINPKHPCDAIPALKA